jgi:hypothetical protein
MQSQGTDGLSRGRVDAGVMQGSSMLSYIPLYLSAIAREPCLVAWIQFWFGGEPYMQLQPFDWFHTGHHHRRAVWSPPPAAAGIALEQLATAIHKRPYSQHVVLIPRLLCPAWRKLLSKLCDIIFTVPLGSDIWPSSNFEPLIIGIYFFLRVNTDRGDSATPLCWTTWWANCQLCQGLISIGGGSFAPISQHGEELGMPVTALGTGGAIAQPIMGSFPLPNHKMKLESSWSRIVMMHSGFWLVEMETICLPLFSVTTVTLLTLWGENLSQT